MTFLGTSRPQFWHRLGGAGAHYTLSGGSLAAFQALLGTLLESFGRARLSLGTLWNTLWSFGSHLTLRRDAFESAGSSTVSQGVTKLLWVAFGPH